MQQTDENPPDGVRALVRHEWSAFRTRRRLLAMTVAALLVVVPGLLLARADRSSCSAGPVEVACPVEPVAPDGRTVRDRFTFVHRDLGENGSITVRTTSMTGIITYPPPDHDEIVAGLVPWAKVGILVKDGVEQGSAYAALMVTGSHGVRMQHGYVHDVAGGPGGVSAEQPRWLRLTRSGDTVTGHESTDGARWTEVGTAHLPGLPPTVQVGLVATSPDDLTLTPVALGGSLAAARFTQASGTVDSIAVDGGSEAAAGPDGAAADGWRVTTVGESGTTDWERFHRPPGLVESGGAFTVTGSGDIGPAGSGGDRAVEDTLVGLALAAIVVIVVGVRFAGVGARPGGRVLVAKAVVTGGAAFLTGLVAAGVVVPLGTAVRRAGGTVVQAVPPGTELRVVVGVAALLAAASVLALALGALVRRSGVAVGVAVTAVVLPYLLGAVPLLPDAVSAWLLRLTPAAGFAVQQTRQEHHQVVAHHAVSTGHFPLPWWAGLTVLGACAAAALGSAALRRSRPPHQPRPSRSRRPQRVS